LLKAVKYCQSIGIAEADPSNDVDGWDAAVKVAALVTVLMRTRVKPQQVDRTGIRGITPQMIRDAQQKQQRYKLVASATRAVDGSIRTRVAPELVDATSSLYFLMGASAGLQFSTDVIGDLSLIETEREGLVPGPDPTAFGLLADFVSLHRR
jgi:homoserine dehydrogenase